jgi:hypothetical protein
MLEAYDDGDYEHLDDLSDPGFVITQRHIRPTCELQVTISAFDKKGTQILEEGFENNGHWLRLSESTDDGEPAIVDEMGESHLRRGVILPLNRIFYSYDEFGRIVRKDTYKVPTPNEPGSFPPKESVEFSYDEESRIRSIYKTNYIEDWERCDVTVYEYNQESFYSWTRYKSLIADTEVLYAVSHFDQRISFNLAMKTGFQEEFSLEDDIGSATDHLIALCQSDKYATFSGVHTGKGKVIPGFVTRGQLEDFVLGKVQLLDLGIENENIPVPVIMDFQDFLALLENSKTPYSVVLDWASYFAEGSAYAPLNMNPRNSEFYKHEQRIRELPLEVRMALIPILTAQLVYAFVQEKINPEPDFSFKAMSAEVSLIINNVLGISTADIKRYIRHFNGEGILVKDNESIRTYFTILDNINSINELIHMRYKGVENLVQFFMS